MCEGDDFWIDPLKLQKQVDFLDSNSDCSICYHPIRILTDDPQLDLTFPPKEIIETVLNTGKMSIDSLLPNNLISTVSVMYRWRFNDKEKIQDVFPDNILPGDYFLHLLHAQKGKIGFINELMAIYRANSGGIWNQTASNLHEHYLKYGIRILNFYIALEKAIPEYNKIVGHKFTCEVAKIAFDVYLKNLKFEEMKQVMDLCPDLFEYGAKV